MTRNGGPPSDVERLEDCGVCVATLRSTSLVLSATCPLSHLCRLFIIVRHRGPAPYHKGRKPQSTEEQNVISFYFGVYQYPVMANLYPSVPFCCSCRLSGSEVYREKIKFHFQFPGEGDVEAWALLRLHLGLATPPNKDEGASATHTV